MKNKNVIIVVVLAMAFIGIIVFMKNRGVSSGPASLASTAKQLYKEAAALKGDNKLLEAKDVYQKILNEHPDIGNVETIQRELEGVNLAIILSNVPTPNSVLHEVKPGDTLGKIAKKYGVTLDLVRRSNNLRGDTISVGQKLRIWQGHFNVFVDKSQNMLILKDGDDVVKVYQVSTGSNNSTPVGKFKIINKLVDPVWFNKGVVVPPESPQNVLGSRWMGFDLPGYGIHGTIEPETIGQHVTAGCVRMRNEEVEELYGLLPVGTEVTVAD